MIDCKDLIAVCFLGLLLGACDGDANGGQASDPMTDAGMVTSSSVLDGDFSEVMPDQGGFGEMEPDQGAGRNCDGVAEGEQTQRTRYVAASIPYGEMCLSEEQTCTCMNREWVDCSGTFTAVECSVECPSGADRVGGSPQAPDCECAPGFAIIDGRCVPRCEQENQHYDAASDSCVCDENHFLLDEDCVHGDQLCPENGHYSPGPDGAHGCICNEGFIINFDGDACVLPSEECPEGRPRLIINDELVLCCPPNALSVEILGRDRSCRCVEGERYDPEENTCS